MRLGPGRSSVSSKQGGGLCKFRSQEAALQRSCMGEGLCHRPPQPSADPGVGGCGIIMEFQCQG